MKNIFLIILLVIAVALFLSACITITKTEETKSEVTEDTSEADATGSSTDKSTGDEIADSEKIASDSDTSTDKSTKTYSQEAGGFSDQGSGVLGIGGGSVNTEGICPRNTFLTMRDCEDFCKDKVQGNCEELEQYDGCYACWELEDSGCVQGEYGTLQQCENAYGEGRCVRVVGPLSCYKKGR